MTVNGDGSFSLADSAEVGNSGIHMIDRETASLLGSKDGLIVWLQFPQIVKFAGPCHAAFESRAQQGPVT
jgi:hypothetical protein